MLLITLVVQVEHIVQMWRQIKFILFARIYNTLTRHTYSGEKNGITAIQLDRKENN